MNPSCIGLIHDLPETWLTVRLGDIATLKGGFGFPVDRQGKKHGEYPFFKVSDMNLTGNEKFMRTSNNWIDSTTLKDLKAKTFPKSAIVFPKIGAALLTNKKRMLVCDAVIDNNVMAVVVKEGSECLPEYLYQWFLTLDLARIANPGTVPSLTASRLAEALVPLPPTREQRKIAAVLGLVQQAIEQQERLIALTTELKKALLHKLFTEGLHGEPQKQTEIGPVPASWQVVPLGDVAAIERGKFAHRPRNHPRFYGGLTPFVQTGDVSNCDGKIRTFSQTLNEEGVGISKIFSAGTILITIAANIGFSGILEFDSVCPDSLIGLTPNHRISTEFLQYYLSTQQPEMDRLAPRGTQKNISIQFLKPWPIRLPPTEDRKRLSNL